MCRSNGHRSNGRARLALLGLFAALPALIVGAELWLRAGGWSEPPPPFEALARERLAGVAEFRYHPERFYTLAPQHRWSPGHLGRYATGDWPFRGRPPEPAPAGLARVAVVGDSAMFGFGVETSESVPWLLQEELAARGLGPERVAVFNYGVSGYTTVQVDLCLAEVLRGPRPDVVVVGCGGWNDQGPSLGVDDVAMLVREPPPAWARWLPALAARLSRPPAPIVLPEVDPAELKAAWERGEPRFGTKVPADQVQPTLERALARCAEAGVPAVVVVPAHPAETLARYPRTRADRDAVRRAAQTRGVSFVDGPALFAESGLSDEMLHLDFGHPTAEGNALVARALAERVAPLLAELPPPAPSPLLVDELAPRRASILGDVLVTLRVRGLPPGELPAVVIGGAPLLALTRAGDELRGLLMANGEGRQGLLVQSSAGCAWVPDALELVRPWLEALPGGAGDAGDPPRVRVHARPGDAVQLFWSDAPRAEPVWWEAGPILLAGTPRPPLEPPAVCGADGTLEVALPEEAAALPRLFAQARVGPRDAGPWERVSVASRLLEVTRGSAASEPARSR